MEAIKEKVFEIIKDISEKEEIQETDSLETDVGLDSLKMVMLLIDIEESFGIELDESDMNPFDLKTVNDVIKLVKKYCNEK